MTQVSVEALHGLPGPLVKWFLKALGPIGLYQLAQSANEYRATARSIIGLSHRDAEVTIIEGSVDGMIVPPRGSYGFGWDSIFAPAGCTRTFAEMPPATKRASSARSLALRLLATHLGTTNHDTP